MSIRPDSPWRGCAAYFAQPVRDEDELGAQMLVETVYYINCRLRNPPLVDIIYRSSFGEYDILYHVFRWDTTPYQHVFENGFHARRQQGTPDDIFFDLNHYVHHAGRPLDSTRPTTHAFVSTTLSTKWHPTPALQPGQQTQVYRYEIYAPGGIWVVETLDDLYQYPAQDEVSFVAGIAPQYVRSAQLYIATREAGSRYVRVKRADNILIVNEHFSPQSHPYRELNIQNPIFDYQDENRRRRFLSHQYYAPGRGKRQVSDDTQNAPINWYAGNVADMPSYINAAFRSSRRYEAYLFMKNEYVLLDYAPRTSNDKIVNGPLLIRDGYPSLIGTAFGEHGIDCAFDSDGNEAFIFSGDLCASIHYAPGARDDKILKGPMTIAAMFPFFKHTVFENGIDAAFRSTREKEAYLFRGDQYALINYDSKNVIARGNITQGFYSLKGTIFASGIDAAFASHRAEEAYLFKGDHCALINFAPGTTDDYMIGDVKPILSDWPSLRGILPRKNRGLDTVGHPTITKVYTRRGRKGIGDKQEGRVGNNPGLDTDGHPTITKVYTRRDSKGIGDK